MSKPQKNSDADRLAFAKSELARLDRLLDEIADLKSRQETAGADFVAGTITLAEASGLLASAAVADRHDLAGVMRGFVKREVRSVLESVQPVVDADRQKKLDALQAELTEAEAHERALAEKHGVAYERGATANALLERVNRLQAAIGSPACREELFAL